MREELAKRMAQTCDSIIETWLYTLWVAFHETEEHGRLSIGFKEGMIHHILEHTRYPAIFQKIPLQMLGRIGETDRDAQELLESFLAVALDKGMSFEELLLAVKNADDTELLGEEK